MRCAGRAGPAPWNHSTAGLAVSTYAVVSMLPGATGPIGPLAQQPGSLAACMAPRRHVLQVPSMWGPAYAVLRRACTVPAPCIC
jgi:hypothetical protein